MPCREVPFPNCLITSSLIDCCSVSSILTQTLLLLYTAQPLIRLVAGQATMGQSDIYCKCIGRYMSIVILLVELRGLYVYIIFLSTNIRKLAIFNLCFLI